MNIKKISIGIGMALVGLVMARTGLAQSVAVNAPSGLQQAVQSRLTGKLSLTIIEQDGEGYRLRAELQGPRFDQTPAPKQDVLPQLSQPFYFTVLPNGQMQSFYFAKGLSADARVLLKQVATSMQSVMPATPSATWHTTEQDVSGEYEATYEANGNNITRTKTKVLRPNGFGGLMAMSPGMNYAVDSKTEVELASSGWPQRIDTNESYDVHLAQAQVSATTRTTASLGETLARPELVGHMPAGVEPESVANLRTAEEMRHKVDVERVAGQRFEQIVAKLGATEKQVRDDAQQQMASLLRLNSADLPKADDTVLKGSLDKDGKNRLMWAIGKADTAEAQATLVSLLNSGETEWRVTAAVTIGLLEQPSEASEDALLNAMSDHEPRVAHAATLALGNLAREVMQETKSADRADRLVGPVIDALKQAGDDFQTRICLEALGNSGHPQALPAIEPYLSSSKVGLRAIAVESLRFIDGSAADNAIIAALKDSESSVRRAAVSTVPYRQVTPLLPALTELMQAEPSKEVRLATVSALNFRRSDTPAVDTLLHSLQSHPAPEVKELANEILK